MLISSHRSFVINMYVITMAWRCISLWSFHRSLQRRREMDIFHICQQSSAFWSKNNLRLNARKHWESESRNRNLSAAVLHVKPSRHDSNLYDSRENHHKVEILNYSISRQYRKQNRDFITINFRKFSFFQGVFSVLKRYIGSEPWDLFPLTIECYRKCKQNYTGTLSFFWLFLLQKAELCWHIWKISISRLLWSDRWKLHREIQRHAIVITYMFMTNDLCEDSFV